jgi:hypothetical protein
LIDLKIECLLDKNKLTDVAPCFRFREEERRSQNIIGAAGVSASLVLKEEHHGNGVEEKRVVHP